MSLDNRPIQPRTLRRLHTLLGKAGIKTKEGKSEVIQGTTQGRTTSSKELLEYEAIDLCKRLEALQKPKPAIEKAIAPDKKEVLTKLRRTVISQYRQMDYNTMREGKMVADMPRIQAKLKERWGKELNHYTEAELKNMIGVLVRNIVPHYLKNRK